MRLSPPKTLTLAIYKHANAFAASFCWAHFLFMKFTKASELKKHIGCRVQWVRSRDTRRGVEYLTRGKLDRVEGRNLVIDGDYIWFANVKDSLEILPNAAVREPEDGSRI